MRSLFLLVSLISFFQLSAQNYWEHYSTNDGMVQNQLTGAVIEDQENIWLLSDFDLIKFNYQTKQFNTSYNNNNTSPTLISQNYKNLIEANGKIWFSHDHGLTSIDSATITNYNTTNGLLSTNIQGLTTDTSGQLWIATPQGISHFNDSIFIHDTTVAAYHIAIDDSNRIFIVNRRFNIIFNNNGPFLTHQVYDGNSWTTPPVTGLGSFPVGLLNVKLVQTSEGIFVTSKDNTEGIYKLTFPFNFDSIPLSWPRNNGNTNYRINRIAIADNGIKWVTSDQKAILYSASDSLLTPFQFNPAVQPYVGISANNELIVSEKNLTLFGSGNGIFIGNNIQQAGSIGEEFNLNQIRTEVSVLGPLFYNFDQTEGNFEFPAGSGKNAIFQAQFIHVHKKATQNFYESNLINPLNRTHDIGPVSNKAMVNNEWAIDITKAEIDLHLASINNRSYVSPDKIANWPAMGNTALGINIDMAPFVDVDNDGCYEPDIGDYPYIKGDEAIYWINHIGKFEYHGMLYGYADSSIEMQQSLFLDYTVINRDTAKYSSVKLGMYVDFNLGNPSDDYIGCDSSINSFYVYNADTLDENVFNQTGYGSNPPALGIRFLNDSLSSFISYSNGSSYNGTPTTTTDWNNYLNGFWRDGQPITNTGSGRNTTGSVTKFMFPGNPLTGNGWNELTPMPQIQSDRRVISSIPSFPLNLNERKTISLALSFGIDSNNTVIAGNINTLKATLDLVKQKWNANQTNSSSFVTPSCILLTSLPEKTPLQTERINLYPNPSNGGVTLNLTKIRSNELLNIYNLNGKLLESIEINQLTTILDFSDYKNGIYVLQIGHHTKKLILMNE